MGQMMTDLDVRVEIEAFDTGHLWFAKQLEKEGVIKSPDSRAAVHGYSVGCT